MDTERFDMGQSSGRERFADAWMPRPKRRVADLIDDQSALTEWRMNLSSLREHAED
ncbi:hypothetical protein [Thauera sp.]|uniref:hypothetical protein n=1 Tax=Thauera sp. TaxID=1905334 RepID=UPI002622B22B|nr:hypothetical protein [Thauera sp.]